MSAKLKGKLRASSIELLSCASPMRRGLSLGLSIGMACGLASLGRGGVLEAAPPSRSAALRAEPKLSAAISLAEKDRPLGDLLPEIEKRLNVKLSAAAETADDKVTLYVKNQPAAEVLDGIAKQFDFQWRKTGDRYELWQDLQTRNREAAQRRSTAERQFAAIRVMMSRMAAASRLSDEELDAQMKRLGLPKPDATLDQIALRFAEGEALSNLSRGFGAGAAGELFRTMKPAEVQQLLSGKPLFLTTTGGEIGAQTGAAMVQSLAQDLGQRLKLQSELPSIGSSIEARLELSTSRPPAYPDAITQPRGFQFSCRINITGRGASTVSTQFKPMDPRMLEAIKPTETQDPQLLKTVDLKPPGPPANESLMRDWLGMVGGHWPSWPTVSDVAEALHREAGLDLVSDSYARYRVDPGRISGRRTVVSILDELRQQLMLSWKKDGNLIRLRALDYPSYRIEEVPERILRPVRAAVDRTGGLSLDGAANLAGAVSDPQAVSLSECWGWYLQRPHCPPPGGQSGFEVARPHLLLWAALSAPQRAALTTGGGLSARTMPPRLRSKFDTAFRSVRQADAGSPGPASITPPAIQAGGLRLSMRSDKQRAYRTTSEGGIMSSRHPEERSGLPAEIRKVPNAKVEASPPLEVQRLEFQYYLGGADKPARKSVVEIIRMPPWPAPSKTTAPEAGN